MRLLVFGASGRTGRWILHEAPRTDEVTAFERTERLLEAHRIFVGDVLDPDAVAAAMSGQEAVLCALGPTHDGPVDLCSRATRVILQVMRAEGVRRLVAITGAMAAHPHEHLGLAYRWMPSLMPAAQKALLEDHRHQESLIRHSELDWTIVRPPRLTDGAMTRRFEAGENVEIGSLASISRADVADFMLRAVHDPRWIHRAVGVVATEQSFEARAR